MPTVFGPAPGPRNIPKDREHLADSVEKMMVGVSARTDRQQLEPLLPPRFEVRDDPLLSVAVLRLRDIGWLAGRGYNIVTVSIPVTYRGDEDTVAGDFLAVLWESLADPVVTGRDELGFPKLWANIPDPILLGSSCSCSTDWLGFRFFELEVDDLTDAAPESPTSPVATLTYKYVPRSTAAARGEADVEYVTAIPAEPPSTVHRSLTGRGSFRFHPPRWEDMPTQYPIVSALAALPLDGFADAFIRWSSGGEVGSEQRILS
jgi:hypothetical protein